MRNKIQGKCRGRWSSRVLRRMEIIAHTTPSPSGVQHGRRSRRFSAISGHGQSRSRWWCVDSPLRRQNSSGFGAVGTKTQSGNAAKRDANPTSPSHLPNKLPAAHVPAKPAAVDPKLLASDLESANSTFKVYSTVIFKSESTEMITSMRASASPKDQSKHIQYHPFACTKKAN